MQEYVAVSPGVLPRMVTFPLQGSLSGPHSEIKPYMSYIFLCNIEKIDQTPLKAAYDWGLHCLLIK